MKIKKSTLQNITIGLGALLVVGFLLIMISNNTNSKNSTSNSNVVSIVDGNQVIDLTASNAGYSPEVIEAKGGTNTTLRVTSSNLFACSSSLRIPKLNISENLDVTGIKEIALGTQAPGIVINGTCSMGMYRFQIKFT